MRLSAPPVVHDGLAMIPVASWEESRALNPEYPCCTFRGSLTALRMRDGSDGVEDLHGAGAARRTGKTSAGADDAGAVRRRHLGRRRPSI